MFIPDVFLGLKDARDGTVNTMLFVEIGRNNGGREFQGGMLENVSTITRGAAPASTRNYTNPNACVTAATTAASSGVATPGRYPATPATGTYLADRRGDRWTHYDAVDTAVTAILPPNGPSCVNGGNEWEYGIFSAGSYHGGGVQAVMADGSVQFINETINAGSAGSANVVAGQSPYGVWGALSTRSAGDSTDGAF